MASSKERDKDVSCTVCFNIRRDVKLFQCLEGHLICEKCVPGLKDACPFCRAILKGQLPRNRVLEKILSSSETYSISCQNVDNGCSFEGVKAELDPHEKECTFQLVECVQCHALVPLCELHEHDQKHHIPCVYSSTGCRFTGNLTELMDHIGTCQYETVACTICNETLIMRDLEAHTEDQHQECQHSITGCTFQGSFAAKLEHEPECPSRLVTCQGRQCSSCTGKHFCTHGFCTERVTLDALWEHCFEVHDQVEAVTGDEGVTIFNRALQTYSTKKQAIFSFNKDTFYSHAFYDKETQVHNFWLTVEASRARASSYKALAHFKPIHKRSTCSASLSSGVHSVDEAIEDILDDSSTLKMNQACLEGFCMNQEAEEWADLGLEDVGPEECLGFSLKWEIFVNKENS